MNDVIFKNSVEYKTYLDIIEKLNKYGKCAMIRCTGFGKTYLMSNITKNYKKVLYLYPKRVIGETLSKDYFNIIPKNTMKMTYNMFVRIVLNKNNKYAEQRDEFFKQCFDLVILDELHCIGAELCSKALKEILSYWEDNGCHILGGTATPYRLDGVDVIGDFFENITTFEYTLNDSIRDGIIKKPTYICGLYEYNEIFKEVLDKVKEYDKIPTVKSTLTSLKKSLIGLPNVSEILRKNIIQYRGENIDSLRFVVFFPTQDSLLYKRETVKKWFQLAFTDMEIEDITVINTHKYYKNLNKVLTLKSKKNTIQLIFCVDMLNLGYHIPDVDGIVMLRSTVSNIIYTQQIGRCLSVMSDKCALIFDFVQNILNGYLFNMDDINSNKNNDNKVLNDFDNLSKQSFNIVDYVLNIKTLMAKLDMVISEDREKEILYMYDKKSARVSSISMVFNLPESKVKEILLRYNRIKLNGTVVEYL